MSDYAWQVSPGGTITAGGISTANTVTVTWNTAGPQSVSVNYMDQNGCTGAGPAVHNVTVNPRPADPMLFGPNVVCKGYADNIYHTDNGMIGYTWIVTGDGVITSGAGTNSIKVTWNELGSQIVTLKVTGENGCSSSDVSKHLVVIEGICGCDNLNK